VLIAGRSGSCETDHARLQARGQGLHGRGHPGLAADAPFAAAHLLDRHPGDTVQGLALHLDHRVGQLVNDLLLLLGGEHLLD
jgi:hypothetical protein